MNIVFVGAGRLATHFAQALRDKGHTIEAVYSRTMESAIVLCQRVGGKATNNIDDLPLDADVYIVAVKDSVLPTLIPQLSKGRERKPMFHTAGSMPMSVFGSLPSHGVIYPMQTFSKEREVDFSRIHMFIEANNDETLSLAREIAESVSNHVHELSGEERRYLHLAAVFACNFSNHCYTLAADILEHHGLPFEAMLPLIEETAAKVETMHPQEAQTGPAVRYDENVIGAQQQLLADDPLKQQLYTLLSQSIHQYHSTPHSHD